MQDLVLAGTEVSVPASAAELAARIPVPSRLPVRDDGDRERASAAACSPAGTAAGRGGKRCSRFPHEESGASRRSRRRGSARVTSSAISATQRRARQSPGL
jgi:hypothetical protein